LITDGVHFDWERAYAIRPNEFSAIIIHVKIRADAIRPNPYKIMKYDPQIHHRRSIRLKGYDYTQPGAYFVTMVTYHRDEIFGEVVNGEMKLSALGQIVHDEWMRSIGVRKEIQLYEDEFTVMPNHAHGIVWIVETVGTDGIRPELNTAENQGVRRTPQPTPQSALRRVPKSLGSFIAGFKASVSSRAKRELNMTGIWQKNYYEHIIRSEKEFENIWKYISDNPRKWSNDQLHPLALPNKFNQE
jgi:REP element-mobilizing transposase RayT